MKLLYIFLFAISGILKSETVVCSFAILQDLCVQICKGTDIQVLTIVPNSVDPHLYQPKPSDSKTLAHADLVITNGLNLEGWIEGIIAASGYQGVILVASGKVEARYTGNLPDPHIWHNPRLVCQMLQNIAAGLSKTFPKYAGIFSQNLSILQAVFKNLEVEIIKLFQDVPKHKRIMLTTHDAFSYFAKIYGITVLSPQGVSTSDDPSAADMKNLIKQIRSLSISAIFLENLANPKILNTIALETKKAVKGVLFADTLKSNTNLQDTLMYNARTIVKAMRDDA